MENIKKRLKIYNMTLAEFAARLNISRPTLDNYILLYQNKNESLNEKYKIIFDSLFPINELNRAEFYRRLDDMENLLLRDRVFETLDMTPEISDDLSSYFYNFKNTFVKCNMSEEFITFFQDLLRNYESSEFVQRLKDYVLIMCGHKNLSNMSNKNIAAIVGFCKLENNLDSLQIDKKYLNLIEKVIKENEEANIFIDKHVQQMINDRIKEKEIKINDRTIKISIED